MTTPRRTIHLSARTTGALTVRPARARTPKVQEALEARDALATALSLAGIQLPVMDVRTPWQDTESGEGGDERDGGPGSAARYALIHLGVCSAPVAHALAAVIAKGAGR